jgi:hypothetical protein
LVKRTRIWINNGREISLRDIAIASADIWQVNQPAEGMNILRGSLRAGTAGRDCSWQVDGVAEIQVGTTLNPFQTLDN